MYINLERSRNVISKDNFSPACFIIMSMSTRLSITNHKHVRHQITFYLPLIQQLFTPEYVLFHTDHHDVIILNVNVIKAWRDQFLFYCYVNKTGTKRVSQKR